MSRRKHMIRCERMPRRCWASAWARRRPVITVPNSMPRVVWAWGSKNISTYTRFWPATLVK